MGIGSRTVFRKYCFINIPEGYTFVSEKYDKEFKKYYVNYADSEGKILYLNQVWQENENPQNLTSDAEIIRQSLPTFF